VRHALTDARYTRTEYLLLPEDFPAQLIEGNLVKEPGPEYGHLQVENRVNRALIEIVGPDRVLVSRADTPIDEWNVFQPDLAVFREAPPPEGRGTVVPLLVVEILSPSTEARDRRVKAPGYLRAGVVEVWLVDPRRRRIEIHSRDGVVAAEGDALARSRALADFVLVPARLFAPVA
jgi:Uma2 family endonuclease